ncbi:pyroglutamyl-peptidase I [uncultured Clostridium sp.]|uniref:pyroglutamyl-peptidase I n=1 Tax=uncultured Clostridium sp. TaxID=59620 RepID=UPI0025E854D6|nr:pyroglutamyl-peptidase I [uncultured Clostridium sp.]
MKVLITGFDPFGGEKVNPALEAVKRLPDTICNAEIIKLEIPTVFGKSLETIEENILKHNPDIVISIGQAAGRFGITPERIAININDASIKDNESNQPIDLPVFEDGENAYFTTLPIKSMIEEMKANEIPCSVSNTAGTFVCNHVMYGVLYMATKKYPNIKGGFIHVPYIPSQVLDKPNMPSMSIENIVKGLELCIKAAVTNNKDVKTIGGTIC